MTTCITSYSTTTRLLMVMLAMSAALALMGLFAPFSVAENVCWEREVGSGMTIACGVPCGIWAGMSPVYQVHYLQVWCCNAYGYCLPRGEVYSRIGGFIGCAFC